MKLIKWLSILLSLSLGANLWFSWDWYQQSRIPIETRDSHQNRLNESSQNSWTSTNSDNSLDIIIDDSEQGNSDFTADNLSQASHLGRLKTLAKQQEFEILEYETRSYLRLYPQDNEAMMLEALAYYHNKPLNTALVHYHELLSKSLSPLQSNEIEKIIAVNTTRVIQQFSGDGAWDLLAEFLEPLVQVAPLNRTYLMALARAYGMQSQFTLMESVLANFPSNDIRAARLRDNVTARIENAIKNEPLVDTQQNTNGALLDDRRADVLLKEERGQFITSANLIDIPIKLLIDTGASTTAISDVIFSSIDTKQVEFIGLFNVNTAGGSIEAPIFKVRSITIGQRTVHNTSVLVLPKENLGNYDGLLGMNVLSQFDIIYDAATTTMRMYKKR